MKRSAPYSKGVVYTPDLQSWDSSSHVKNKYSCQFNAFNPWNEKQDNNKFNGRKGVRDEVLELPIRIMQSNTGQLVRNERLSHHAPKAQAPLETTAT